MVYNEILELSVWDPIYIQENQGKNDKSETITYATSY